MGLDTDQKDSLGILASTKYVLDKAGHVTINEESINPLAIKIETRLHEGLPSGEEAFGELGSFEKKAQLSIVVDSVNFCFWAEKGKTKWQTEWPKGNFVGGAFGRNAVFKRALINDIPILDANYLSNITLEQTKEIFKSSNEVEIPLIKERQKNLCEVGLILNKTYNGKFMNLIKKTNFDAIDSIRLIKDSFTSFNDVHKYDNQEITFLKRAQICVYDLSLFKLERKLSNSNQFTAFSDYKLPQILREFGVIQYSSLLAEKVDNMDLIPGGSKEEIEIRAATIWGVELIRQKLKKYNAAEIDNAIWYLSQDQTGLKPFHRTYTIYY